MPSPSREELGVRLAVLESQVSGLREDLQQHKVEIRSDFHEIRTLLGREVTGANIPRPTLLTRLGLDMGDLIKMGLVIGAIAGGMWYAKPNHSELTQVAKEIMEKSK